MFVQFRIMDQVIGETHMEVVPNVNDVVAFRSHNIKDLKDVKMKEVRVVQRGFILHDSHPMPDHIGNAGMEIVVLHVAPIELNNPSAVPQTDSEESSDDSGNDSD